MPDVSVAPDYRVKDMSLAGWGRKEIAMAEEEMPGLMATGGNTASPSRWLARESRAACT